MARQQPPLYEIHEAAGASFTDFGGWDMPVEFDSIRTEHSAVRESAGIFDVSHMGEIEVTGPDATTLMQRLTTNDVTALDPGDSQYAAITTEEGVIIDDTVVYRLPHGTPAGEAVDGRFAAGEAEGDHPTYLFIPNAGHDGQAFTRWVEYRDEHDLDADVENTTDAWAMFAIQGPDAPDLVFDAIETGSTGIESTAGGGDAAAVRDLSRFQATHAEVAGIESWVARTGYTGEDGFEVLCPAVDAETVWAAFDCQPCGLGARDTLRMEYGFLLSGQDFHPQENPRTPFEAGIDFAVDLDTEFVGRDALAEQDEAGIEETFTGLVLEERGVPRQGYEVTDGDGTTVGELTSGTMSPTLDEPIGLGYVDVDYADDGTEVGVVVRGEEKRATITSPPFIS
ncbi:MAG: glycine cleavage system aminomethyltransferase GcvT [Halopenitus sp.]